MRSTYSRRMIKLAVDVGAVGVELARQDGAGCVEGFWFRHN